MNETDGRPITQLTPGEVEALWVHAVSEHDYDRADFWCGVLLAANDPRTVPDDG